VRLKIVRWIGRTQQTQTGRIPALQTGRIPHKRTGKIPPMVNLKMGVKVYQPFKSK